MASTRPSIRHGRIIFAWIKDRNGYKKLRPALILTPDDEISPDAAIAVMAITTTFADPPPEFCVPVPWHPRGHPVTQLNQRSAAVVNWLADVGAADIIGYGGDVPAKTMRLIQAKLDQLQ